MIKHYYIVLNEYHHYMNCFTNYPAALDYVIAHKEHAKYIEQEIRYEEEEKR